MGFGAGGDFFGLSRFGLGASTGAVPSPTSTTFADFFFFFSSLSLFFSFRSPALAFGL